jgi:hypothetical protein
MPTPHMPCEQKPTKKCPQFCQDPASHVLLNYMNDNVSRRQVWPG